MTEPEVSASVSSHAQPARPAVPRWRKLLPLVGLGLLAWIVSRLELGAMGAAFAQASLASLLASGAAFTLNTGIKALRWHRLLSAQALRLPLGVSIAAYLSGQFYGQVTLGRVGELFRAEALMERGASAGTALASSLFDRLLDVFVVLAAGVVFGAFVLGDAQLAVAAGALMSVGGAALWIALSIASAEAPAAFMQRTVAVLERSPIANKLLRVMLDLARGMRPMARPRALLEAVIWTLLSWGFYFAALFILASDLSIEVSKVVLTATAAFAALSALLPITVNGLGARELIYISVLQAHGIAREPAVVLSLLHLAVMTASATLFGFAGVLWRSRQHGPR